MLRNLVVHNNVCVDLISIIQGLELRMIEHLDALKGANIARSPKLCCWKCPPGGVRSLMFMQPLLETLPLWQRLLVMTMDMYSKRGKDNIFYVILSKSKLLLYFGRWS
jgi:hypothetical protein